ncbi:hypothetical protein EZV62_003097 [Acer yangbiense]|uniref:Uncharacterized protein n=1 Tax=Acer yangbiense TaxID=1000413 RepID=A0A5C7IH69_9ROSI|nr:hypothetical protein EZV62_003097 [Acer yangbiense]
MEEAVGGQFSQVYSLNESKEDNRDVLLASVGLLLPCEIFFEILSWLPVKTLNWTENSSSPRIRSRLPLRSDTTLLFAVTRSSSPHDTVSQMKYLKPVNFYKEIFKEILMKKDLKHGRLLGLDVSDEFVSLAMSDWKNLTAVPLRALDRQENNPSSMAADIFQSLIPEHNLVGFVVGTKYTYPIDAQTQIFIDDLRKTGKVEGLKYTIWDRGIRSKNSEFVLKQHLKFILENMNQPQHMSKTIMENCHAVSAPQDFARNEVILKDVVLKWDSSVPPGEYPPSLYSPGGTEESCFSAMFFRIISFRAKSFNNVYRSEKVSFIAISSDNSMKQHNKDGRFVLHRLLPLQVLKPDKETSV